MHFALVFGISVMCRCEPEALIGIQVSMYVHVYIPMLEGPTMRDQSISGGSLHTCMKSNSP